ncbi:MAG: hypothetical protein KDA60_04220, partial [Planctomycetales bacterium]|nr:hypothetical protein [Planctomycetales bacterium]
MSFSSRWWTDITSNRSQNSPPRRTPSSLRWRRHHVEELESRRVLSSLLDYVIQPASLHSDVPGAAQATGVVDWFETNRFAAADAELVRLANQVPLADVRALDHVDNALQRLYSRHLAGTLGALQDETIYGIAYSQTYLTDGTRPQVEVYVERDANVRQQLTRLGFDEVHALTVGSTQAYSGYLPVPAIVAAARLPGIKSIDASLPPLVDDATVNVPEGGERTEWVEQSRADQLQRLLGVDGSGVTVGILSDSFDSLGTGLGFSRDGHDLPPGNRVHIYRDNSDASATDEGRALAELVYDLGQGFDFHFATSQLDEVGAAVALEILASADTFATDDGVDVIIEDASYIRQPVFQQGVISQKVDEIYEDEGVLVFGSAGNAGGSTRYQTWKDTPQSPRMDFQQRAGGVADTTLQVLLPPAASVNPGDQLQLVLQWSEPWMVGNVLTDLD